MSMPFFLGGGGAYFINDKQMTMEKCVGDKSLAISYCSYLPCYVSGGSFEQCRCNYYDIYCTEFKDAFYCAMSKCCQAQADDDYAWREAHFMSKTSLPFTSPEKTCYQSLMSAVSIPMATNQLCSVIVILSLTDHVQIVEHFSLIIAMHFTAAMNKQMILIRWIAFLCLEGGILCGMAMPFKRAVILVANEVINATVISMD